MKLVSPSGVMAWMRRLLFPGLLLLLAIWYLHGMAGYVSPLSTPDEFGYVSVAAFLAGHDWTAVAHGIPWYSYGYSLLLAPVFALTSPSHWYHAAQWMNIALIVALGVCANLFLRKLDRVSRPWLRYLVVAAIMLYPSVVFYARFAWAETLIAVLPWLLGLLMYRLFEAPRRYVDAFLCGCLLMAAYYIHARLIVMLIAGLLVLTFVAFKTRRWHEFGVVIFGMIVVLIPALWFKDYLIVHLYGGAMHGSQGSIVKMLVSVWHRLGEPGAWRDFVGSAAGQFVYLVIATLGLLIAGLAVCGRRIWQGHRQREWAGFAALTFVLLAAAGSYALILMTMGLSPGHPHHVFYGRYTEPFVLPIVAMGLLYLCQKPRRAYVWMVTAFAIACVLVPIGVYVARQLPDQATYWTPITGLFTYRAAHWTLDTDTLLTGFLVVAAVMSLAFRVHRYAGLVLAVALFLMADIGLVQSFATAPYSHVQKWHARAGSAFEVRHPEVLLDMQNGDPLYLRARVQVINAGLEVIPKSRWSDGQASAYERIDWNGKAVVHSICRESDLAGADHAVCKPIASNPYRATVRLGFHAHAITLNRSHLPTPVYLYLSGLPYLNGVWRALFDTHIRLHYAVAAPVANVVVVKVFVTRPGSGNWLVDRLRYFHARAGTVTGSLRMPVPVHSYAGVDLPKGDYTLHAVVVGPKGNNWGTLASIPMHID